MAKIKKVASYCKVTPIGRRRLDPYTSQLVQLGENYILDSDKAQMLSDMGEVEIIEENVTPPWAIPVVKDKVIEKETEVKAKA